MSGWPPIYVQVGKADILYDQIVSFCQHCGQKGADMQLDTWEGMTHDFQAFGEQMPESSEALKRLGEFSEEPYDFPGGRRFHFRDPFGYELAVWTDK